MFVVTCNLFIFLLSIFYYNKIKYFKFAPNIFVIFLLNHVAYYALFYESTPDNIYKTIIIFKIPKDIK